MLTGRHLLRVLRKQRHKSLESVAEDVGISYKCLSELERGNTCQPSHKLLETVLKVLNGYMPVPMEEQRAVYIGYGYTPPCPLPTDEEIAAARACWRDVFHKAPTPAYLIDVGQRLLACNRAAHHLIALCSSGLRVGPIRHATTIDLIFGPAPRLTTGDNHATFKRAFVHTLWHELRDYATEPWCAEVIAAACQSYPEFKALWEAAETWPLPDASPDPLTLTVRLPECEPPQTAPPQTEGPQTAPPQTAPPQTEGPQTGGPQGGDLLTFRRDKAPFVGDPRFQTVLWQPADAATWRAWGMFMP